MRRATGSTAARDASARSMDSRPGVWTTAWRKLGRCRVTAGNLWPSTVHKCVIGAKGSGTAVPDKAA